MKSDDFSEQYRHPKWQKKRLEILERDEYECCHCGEKEIELQVHHIEYSKGKKVWEYQNDNFMTLCKDCHERITFALQDSRRKAAWEVYLNALESLSEVWRVENREMVGQILHLLSTHPSMINPIRQLLCAIRDQECAAREKSKKK